MKSFRTISFLLILVVSVSMACTPGTSNKRPRIRVAVAANVRHALDEINTNFTNATQVDVDVSIASSGKLKAQIEHGAPFDLFLSANMEYPKALFQMGKCIESPREYARGVLVLWSMQNMDFGDSLQALPSLKRIAIANPANAPYGVAAAECIQLLNLDSVLKDKLVFAENISQVIQYVKNNDVDLGFVNKSAVISPQLSGVGYWSELDTTFYKPIVQGVALIAQQDTSNLVWARRYYNYLFSIDAKQIFRKYGYLIKN